MDQQQIKNAATDTAETLDKAGDAAVQAGGNIQRTLDQGKAVAQDLQDSAASVARQAANACRQAMEQASESGAKCRARDRRSNR